MARVKMPDGQVVEMPDEPTAKQLAELELLHSGRSPISAPAGEPGTGMGGVGGKRGMGEEFMRQLGLTARAGVTGLSGTVGAVGDALNTGINMATGSKLQMPSAMVQKLMSQLGLPEPENTAEKVAQFGASVMAGAKDPLANMVTKGLTPETLYAQPAQMGEHGQTITNAQNLGYTVPPNEAGAGKVGRVVEALSDRGIVEGMSKQKNVNITDSVMKRAIGLPETAQLTDDAVRGLIRDTYEQGYGPVKALGRVPATAQFHKQLDDIFRENQGMSRSFPGAARNDVAELVGNYRVQEFDSEDAIRAIAQLREDAGVAFREGNGLLGKSQKQLAKALEDNIEEYLGSLQGGNTIPGYVKGNKMQAFPPAKQMLQDFRDARRQLAQQYSVKDALVPGTGSGNALELAAQLRQGAPLSGELLDVAKFANVAPKAAGFPKAAPPAMSGFESWMLGGAAAGGFMNPALAAGASLPLARMVGRQLLTSKAGQKMLAQPRAPAGLPDPRFMNMMPALGTGLFGQEYQE